MLNFNKKRFLKEEILEIKGMQLKIKKNYVVPFKLSKIEVILTLNVSKVAMKKITQKHKQVHMLLIRL